MIYTLEDYDDWIKLKMMYVQKHIPKLKHVYIETNNYCNFNCSFCPVGMGLRTEEHHTMSLDFFKHVIDMLSSSNLSNNIKISLYGNNEPLLDDTIIEKINYTREKIPSSYIYMFTNGILLEQYVEELNTSGLDALYIQAYTEKIYNNIIELLTNKHITYVVGAYTTAHTSNIKFYIVKRFEDSCHYTLMNRAGRAYETKDIPNMCCICPFFDAHIDSFGNIQMCTFDALGDTIFDNINNYDTFDAMWMSDKFKDIRHTMLTKGKYGFDACSKCDIYSNRYRLNFYNLE